MTGPECRQPSEGWPTCIARLADGWITPTDLCPSCTQAFMTALDGISGPLVWHHAYTERAGR